MIKKILLISILSCILYSTPSYGQGLDDDYDEILELVETMKIEEEKVSFSDIVKQLVSGDVESSLGDFGTLIYQNVFYEIGINKNAILQIIGIAIIGAVFTNFSIAFSKNYVAETGFYMTYIILFSLLTTSFIAVAGIASNVMGKLLDFMTALVPTFCLALTFTSGVGTSASYHQVMMIVIAIIDWLICKVILNLINVYIILALVNNISKEDYLSKMAELIKIVVSWSIKTILGVTIGLNVIQGMILPAFDSVKNSLLLRATTAIPGVGNAINAAAKTVIGSSVLIKNAIGMGGVIVLIIICLAPLLKLLIVSLMYKVAEAIIQPVSDERIVKCLTIAYEGTFLLLKAVATAVLLFVLSLAIITSSSNFNLG